MKFVFGAFVVFILLFSEALGLLSSSCKKWSHACLANVDCCPKMGHRIVCAPSLEICGKKMCCITEVEEQQEKQAAIIRNRPKSKRIWKILLDDDEEK
ncbi:unnamed protein product [Rotaria sordida]|uniref:Beta-defensin n=1 Tax=Rotaria sordida TaxID=392033 RepID=A0A815M1H8_9BILA|nr:unnamed protein product [Rotaria sordida]CAF3900703.1 unnamed protein product [Rotaria sordida]CAF4026792.1 unnamed protein product [Rotaria sordida]